MKYLLVGGSGLLGSGFRSALTAAGRTYVAPALPWGNPSAVAAAVQDHLRLLVASSPDDLVGVIWAAGTGRVSAESADMELETMTVEAVCRALSAGSRPIEVAEIIFASSAGAVYGGHGQNPVTPGDPPAPITSYGREKLLQEGVVSSLQGDQGVRVLLLRYTNLFGLASGVLRPKGLVAVVVRAALTNQALGVFVNPDTRRDYILNSDAARLSLSLLAQPPSAGPLVEVVGVGHTMTVLEIVSETARVLRKRVPVVFRESAESALQPLVLDFGPRRGPMAECPVTPFPAALRMMAEAPIAH